jgi:hypothetical protein
MFLIAILARNLHLYLRPQCPQDLQLINTNSKQKVLKIAPTEGMKIDKEGILVWVPPEDE